MKLYKKVLIGLLLLLFVQIPWYIIVENTQIRTTATVIKIEDTSVGCTSRRLCDSSNRQYPVYEYTDKSGKRYVQDDRFFGEYKQNNPFGKLFLKKVGDKVPAYYPENNPEEVTFMASPYAYTALLLPSYIALGLSLLFAFITFIFWMRNQSWYSHLFRH